MVPRIEAGGGGHAEAASLGEGEGAELTQMVTSQEGCPTISRDKNDKGSGEGESSWLYLALYHFLVASSLSHTHTRREQSIPSSKARDIPSVHDSGMRMRPLLEQ